MPTFPQDRFDQLPDDLARVGAHRGPRKKGRGWIGFAWAALASGVLVFGGLFAISTVLDIDLGLFPVAETPTPTPTPTPTADPITAAELDPARGIKVTVLNGTPTVGLEFTVATQLVNEGWPVTSNTTANADNVEKTTVYYTDAANEDVARGIALSLGGAGVRLVPPETFPGAPITVVLGADFEVPAA